MPQNKKTYFVSDCHFGMYPTEKSRERERLFIRWLDSIAAEAEEIYILGDLFEFWFEYKYVIPKGYARLFGKLAEITDRGISVYFFRGNHDIWAFDYLEKELGIKILDKPLRKTIHNKVFFLGHGDGLGEGDGAYKFLKKVFSSRINQFLFRWLHPDIGSRLGHYFSLRSKRSHDKKGIEKVNDMGLRRLELYCQDALKRDEDIDYFVFGHVHKPAIIPLGEKAKYISLGDWIRHFSFAVFDGEKVEIKYCKTNLL